MSELPTGIERREFLFMRAENLEDLIRRIYGVEYQFSVAEEATVRIFDVQKREGPSEEPERTLSDIRRRRSYCSTGTLLRDLANRELIPEGRYLIQD